MSELTDSLIEQLELASQESTAGKKSWDEFCKFLTNFETLVELHNPEDTNIKEQIEQKHFCYHIAGEQVVKDPKMAADVLPRIDKLVHSDIFPREASFFAFVNWLDQVTFLFELIPPGNHESDSIPVELLKNTLNITKSLVGFCVDRLKSHKKTIQTAANWRTFEKICCIAKHGVAQEVGLEVNSKAVDLIKQLVLLMNKFQVATIGQEQFDLIFGKLWSIVMLDMRYFANTGYVYNNSKTERETRQALCRETLYIIEWLPSNDEALEFFYNNLRNKSGVYDCATNLTLLDTMLKARNYQAKGIWPILDINLSRNEREIRDKCLDIARGVFTKEDHNLEDFKAMLKHLDSIVDFIRQNSYYSNQPIPAKISELLCSIARQDHSARNEIQLRLIRLLKDTPAFELDEDTIRPMIKAISANHVFPLDANLFRDVAVGRLRLIYQSGLERKKDPAALQALYLLITLEGNHQTSYMRKFVDIIAAGCQGVAPKGCNAAMFSVLNEIGATIGDDNETHLLPLARAIYEQVELSD